MKKAWIVLTNTLIMIVIVVFVIRYSNLTRQEHYQHQTEAFVETSSVMEKVTENYLAGEQRICDIWAQYINSRSFTMEEAVGFIRSSHVLPRTSAHLLDPETMTGLSTRVTGSGSYDISYSNIELFRDLSWISGIGESINITRSYTNPANGGQSLAFCNRIRLARSGGSSAGGSGEGTEMYDALLLRVVPVSELEDKWIYPGALDETAEFAIIDKEGSYILRGRSFKNSSFFEFYKSYNRTELARQQELFSQVTSEAGSFIMNDSKGQECLLVHTPISFTSGWVLLGYAPVSSFLSSTENWTLIGFVSACLLLLLVLDIGYMMFFNRRLQEAAAEAEAASRAKTDFLSTMSHDIRTPMNAIIGLTTLTEHNLDDQEAVRDNLRKISLAGNHLLTLINDILDISKVESGRLTLNPVTFSIVDTVENLVNLSQPMVREKNIVFSFHINRMEKEYLYADQLRLNQIYINILSNAIKYTNPGGQVAVELREEAGDAPGRVRLIYRVADTGIGMTPDFMEKMYQPFSRQTDSRVNTIQGTGLGLAITKQMVDLMGGVIECESEPDRGTTFTVTIEVPAAERQRDEMHLDNVNVLLVDDDAVLLETASDALQSLGAVPECASGGGKALEMIAQRHEGGKDYNVVILDWKMPGMDGLETIRQIRTKLGSSIPILLVSSYDWSDIEEEAREAGANGFISKPLFRSTLYDRISDLLSMEPDSVEPEDDYSDIAGMRVLVAEDIDVNWEIISAMLEMFGISAERAANGRICVEMMEKAEKGRYDLIFMDIQMPEMNGLEATGHIRKLKDPWASSIPIIAMTADAFSENITACLEAGMNGHIAKPIDIKLVIKEIRRIREGEKQ